MARRPRTKVEPDEHVVTWERPTEQVVHPSIWQYLLSLRVDLYLVQLVSHDEVIVWNHRAPWPS